MKLNHLGEFGVIEKLTASLHGTPPGLVKGVGDDCAVFEKDKDTLYLATCDVQIRDVHFLDGKITPYQLGCRIANVNLSDIAAMGGEPTFALASLIIPPGENIQMLEGMYQGLTAELQRAGAFLVGGNTAMGKSDFAVDLFLLGSVPRSGLLTRSGVNPGDVICVTGGLGLSAAGLCVLTHPEISFEREAAQKATAAFLTPRARLDAGRLLSQSGSVCACMDISDGLLQDAGHMARQSGICLKIERDRVPVSIDASSIAHAIKVDAVDWALTGGEDFELLFAVDPAKWHDVRDLLEQSGIACTRIGTAEAGPAAVNLVDSSGGSLDLGAKGYDHFRKSIDAQSND